VDKNTLSHTTWECKYHIVFAPKFRRQVIYGKIKADVADTQHVMQEKGSRNNRGRSMSRSYTYARPDTAEYRVSDFMGYLKGKSSLMIFDRHANLKYKYGNRKFWCRGYYVDTVGKNAKKIEEYIRNQLADDQAYDQMSIKEFVDPFTGEPVNKGNR
jgi:putative transposase